MISLLLAEKLKNAGLVWEPKLHDHFTDNDLKKAFSYPPTPLAYIAECINELIWCPHLDQLLIEIRNRWRMFTLDCFPRGWCLILFSYEELPHQFSGDAADDAAAKALLWILKQEA